MAEHDDVEPARLRLVRAGELSLGTAQTAGMRRSEAISGSACGSQVLWMGETRHTGAVWANHHHGHSETGIYVTSGRPVLSE